MKSSICIWIMFLFPVLLSSQDLYKEMEEMIDPFTGDLRWSKEITSISTSSGTKVPIRLSYSSNVQTNTNASWVGLGFQLGSGEIVRELNGGPDERPGYAAGEGSFVRERKLLYYYELPSASLRENTYIYGPMKYEELTGSSSEKTHDVIFTGENGRDGSFAIPALDRFHLSSPLYGGTFKLTISSVGNQTELHTKNWDLEGKTYESHDFPNQDPRNYEVFHWEEDPFANSYIEYFTKDDVLNNAASEKVNTFFHPYTDEAGNTYDYSINTLELDDIVAFTIVLESGTKLHYSLPVIKFSSKTYTMSVDEATSNIDFKDTVASTEFSGYVQSWKLTAVVGADYSDSNHNDVLDPDDAGDWVRYYYSKWGGKVQNRIPFHGFLSASSPSVNDPADAEKKFEYTSSVTFDEDELYYLEKIATDIETLIFFKSIRKDEYRIKWSGGSPQFIPSLKLSKIAKYTSGDYTAGYSCSSSNVDGASDFISVNNSFLQSTTTHLLCAFSGTPKLINEYDFGYSYVLAPGYYCNIDNSPTLPSAQNVNLSGVPNAGDPSAPAGNQEHRIFDIQSSYGTGGKLTLETMTKLDYNSVNTSGGNFTFNYDLQNNSYFDHNKRDNFGYYNSAVNSHTSNRFVPINLLSSDTPWLLKSVTYPSGNRIAIDFEKDIYEQIATGNASAFNSVVVPIKAIEVESTYYGKITLLISLYDANDKEILRPYQNRTITLRSQFWTCRHNGPNGYSPPRVLSATGSIQYNSSGSLASTSGLEILDLDYGSGIMKVRVNYDDVDADQDDCNIGAAVANLVNRPFFQVSDDQFVGAGYRVQEMRLYERAGTTGNFKIRPEYSNGVIGSVNAPWRVKGGGLSKPHASNYWNALPGVCGYESVMIRLYDLADEVKETATFDYKHSQRYFTGSSRSVVGDCECYIPIVFMTMPFHVIWDYMHREDSSIEIPDLIACSVDSYVNETLIPNTTGLRYSDYDAVYEALKPLFITIEGSNAIKKNRGSEINLYCYRDKVKCQGYWIDKSSCEYKPNVYFNYYPYYVQPENSTLVLNGKIINNSQLFGKPVKVQRLDKHDQVIFQEDYDYQQYVANREIFKFGMEYSSNLIGVMRMNYTYNYYRQHSKVVSSLGVDALRIGSYRSNGLLESSTVASPLIGYSVEAKGYLHEEIPSFGRISGITASGSATPILLPAAPDRGQENIVDIYRTTISKYGIDDYTNIKGYNRTDLLFQTIMTKKIASGSDTYQHLVLGTDATQTVEMAAVGDGTRPYLSLGQVKEVDGNVIEEVSYELFNELCKPIEMYDHSTREYRSTTYGRGGRIKLATIDNCRYKSFTTCGFEYDEGNDYYEGQLHGSSGRTLGSTIGEAHTGNYVSHVSPGFPVRYVTDQLDKTSSHLEEGRYYTAMAWVNNKHYAGNPFIQVALSGSVDNGGSEYSQTDRAYLNDPESISVGDWTLLRVSFEVPQSYTADAPPEIAQGYEDDEAASPSTGESVSGTPSPTRMQNRLVISLNSPDGDSYFDDFRFQPIEAETEMVVFDQNRMLETAKLNSQNFFTKFGYDEAGRIISVWRETPDGIKLIKQNVYND